MYINADNTCNISNTVVRDNHTNKAESMYDTTNIMDDNFERLSILVATFV